MKKFTKYLLPLSLTILLSAFLYTKSFAQYEDELEDITGHYEAGVTAGANAFFGDLGGNKGVGKPFIKDFNAKTTKPYVGVFINYFKYSWLSIKFSLAYTNVDGADSLIKNTGDEERWRYYRNLSFRSRIWEGNVSAEIYPVMMFDHDVEIHTLSPYFGLGLGVFHMNPQTYYQGPDPYSPGGQYNGWVNLQPLRLEGQGFAEYPDRKQFHRLQVYIPLTVGLKIYINNTYAISTGFIFRHTFTDYIDDISTTYIDPSLFDKYTITASNPSGLLTPAQAYLAKQLYERSLTPQKVRPNVYKADPKDNDSYTTFFLTLSIRFGGGPKFFYGG